MWKVKALVGAFNQEKALVGASYMIVKTGCGTDGSFYSTNFVYLLPFPWSSTPDYYKITRQHDLFVCEINVSKVERVSIS